MSFDKLGLSSEILRAIAEQKYTSPTPIQEKAIPVILQGKDLLACAQTGTGKTAAFTLPMLQKLSKAPVARGKRPLKALVLTPTRELAAQVGQSIQTYGTNLPLCSSVIFGGVNIKPQIKALKAGVDILVATPGRLLDHLQQGNLELSRIEIFVLDEADRMLDMGFIHDIKKILALLPAKRQNLLFSATFSREIKSLANRLLNQPTSVEVARRNTAAERVDQRIYSVDRECKHELLSHIIREGDWRQVLVFTRTKHGANRLSRRLEREGITSAAIHGNKSQNARTMALADFKNGRVRVLVATDIAARGLDIDKLPYVVNYELPNVPEDYVHRIGRTGRAGHDGRAISLVSAEEHKLLLSIEAVLKTTIPREVHSYFESNSGATFGSKSRAASSSKPEAVSGSKSGTAAASKQKGTSGTQPKDASRSKPGTASHKPRVATTSKPEAISDSKPATATRSKPKDAARSKPKAGNSNGVSAKKAKAAHAQPKKSSLDFQQKRRKPKRKGGHDKPAQPSGFSWSNI